MLTSIVCSFFRRGVSIECTATTKQTLARESTLSGGSSTLERGKHRRPSRWRRRRRRRKWKWLEGARIRGVSFFIRYFIPPLSLFPSPYFFSSSSSFSYLSFFVLLVTPRLLRESGRISLLPFPPSQVTTCLAAVDNKVSREVCPSSFCTRIWGLDSWKMFAREGTSCNESMHFISRVSCLSSLSLSLSSASCVRRDEE